MSWLKRMFGRRDRGPEVEEVKILSDQFYVTLRAGSSRVHGTEEERQAAARKRVDELLARNEEDDWSWNRAYEVEQQLVHLYDDVTVSTELDRRVLEARAVLRKSVADWYEDRRGDAQDGARRRALLLRIVNDLQWRYTVSEATRNYTKAITNRTGVIFIGAMILFIGAFLLVFLVHDLVLPAALLILATASGTWGASFSMLTGLKARLVASTLDDLKLARSWPLILARVLLGAGAAVVLFFFLRSGLLSGAAFPEFPEAEGDRMPIGQLTLFAVWCFLAGFSEKLVPGLLSKAEGKVASEPEHPPTHFPAAGRGPSPAGAPQPPPGGPAPPQDAPGGGGHAEEGDRSDAT